MNAVKRGAGFFHSLAERLLQWVGEAHCHHPPLEQSSLRENRPPPLPFFPRLQEAESWLGETAEPCLGIPSKEPQRQKLRSSFVF